MGLPSGMQDECHVSSGWECRRQRGSARRGGPWMNVTFFSTTAIKIYQVLWVHHLLLMPWSIEKWQKFSLTAVFHHILTILRSTNLGCEKYDVDFKWLSHFNESGAGAVLRQNGDPLPGPAEEAQEVPKDGGLWMWWFADSQWQIWQLIFFWRTNPWFHVFSRDFMSQVSFSASRVAKALA